MNTPSASDIAAKGRLVSKSSILFASDAVAVVMATDTSVLAGLNCNAMRSAASAAGMASCWARLRTNDSSSNRAASLERRSSSTNEWAPLEDDGTEDSDEPMVSSSRRRGLGRVAGCAGCDVNGGNETTLSSGETTVDKPGWNADATAESCSTVVRLIVGVKLWSGDGGRKGGLAATESLPVALIALKGRGGSSCAGAVAMAGAGGSVTGAWTMFGASGSLGAGDAG
jgi:hypothetical protein